MSLEIETRRETYRGGDVVRGMVRGLAEHAGARGVTVALVHDGDHVPEADAVGIRLGVLDGVDAMPFDLALPLDALPTFRGERFGSAWSIRASVDLRRKIDPATEREIRVLPTPERIVDPDEPVVDETTGTRRFVRALAIFAAVDLVALLALFALVSDPPPAIVAPLAAPLVLSVAIVGLLRGGGPVDALAIELPRARWRFEETIPVAVRIEGDPERIGALEVTLTGAEEWTTSTGSSTRHHRVVFHEETRRFEPHDLAGHRSAAHAWSVAVELAIPEVGFPSIEGKVVWEVRAAVDVPRRPDPSARAALAVSGIRPEGEV